MRQAAHIYSFTLFKALALTLVCCLLLCACSANRYQGAGPSSSRIVSMSREYMPPQGGQTILPPQHMGDAVALWKPLSGSERSRMAKYAPPRDYTPLPAGPVVTAWLPNSEEEVMQSYMYRLTVSHAGVTRRSLERASAYLPDIQRILAEKGLPQELACLPLVESAFQPSAVSHAGAAGLWQLMPATARRFGLRVDSSVDERFDPHKATLAATEYLAWLYGYFKDWPLAIAAYNCGEGTMGKLLDRCNVSSLSELSASERSGGPSLPDETRRFVPQFLAAVSVMSNSGDLGLHATNLIRTSSSGLAAARSGGAPLAPPPTISSARERSAPPERQAPQPQVQFDSMDGIRPATNTVTAPSARTAPSQPGGSVVRTMRRAS